jgi:hypothetical protein
MTIKKNIQIQCWSVFIRTVQFGAYQCVIHSSAHNQTVHGIPLNDYNIMIETDAT